MEANAGDTIEVLVRCWQCGNWMKMNGLDDGEWVFECKFCQVDSVPLAVGVSFECRDNPIQPSCKNCARMVWFEETPAGFLVCCDCGVCSSIYMYQEPICTDYVECSYLGEIS